MLTKILSGGLLASVLANAALAFMLERNKAAWASERAQIATDVATALRSHQALSDVVTREAMARAENSEANLRKFRGDLDSAAKSDPHYDSWAQTKLPAGVAERLGAIE